MLLSPKRAKEELYDLKNDPWELNNLADDPGHSKTLQKMRKILNRWIRDTGDLGQNVEPMKMYDSDMKVYLDNNATTPLRKAAMTEMLNAMGPPANPSSVHGFGRRIGITVC